LLEIEKKTRNTIQKAIILDTIKRLSNHPTVEDVYVEVKKTYANISKNTVYRNLRQLACDEKIRKVSLHDEPERYDKNSKIHYHFQCSMCGEMLDIEMNYIEGINETARQNNTYRIDEHDIVFRGICPECDVLTANKDKC